MDNAQFLQEKIAYLHIHSQQNDLAFYRFFTEKHPKEAVGWLHLAREWEQRGKPELALEAYRQALRCKPDSYQEEAREAYHVLLRSEKRLLRRQRTRRGIASLLLLLFGLLSLPNPAGGPGSPATKPTVSASQTTKHRNHTEVIAVPANMTSEQARAHIKKYLLAQRPTPKQPFSLLIVPESVGTPLFTPLTFYRPQQVKGVLRYDPATQSFLTQKWYPLNCKCENDPAILAAKQTHREEQHTLEQTLILRNALYHHYQRTGRLPDTLSALAGSYPANSLPALPVHTPKAENNGWTYTPTAFQPENPWDSLSNVLPVPGYPEPATPLEPLQIVVNLSSYRMTLMSGSQPVRSYPIGIGKQSSTPEGYFQIQQKINQPRGHDHIYGTRGMIFHAGDYAIHGTNAPKSIGAAMSLGCIRLLNPDVEELYSFVTPGTDVIISGKPAAFPAWSNPQRFVLPAGPEEETPSIVYHWLQ
ncbi:L,D-transpeptidase family protein [Brevibacillus migulae]|uniref:L,D-transpeptidase family protein n=1 Tax=Brevibacillus migulae TaxID=1644114 RepID=UPI00106E5C47|nr:L,D-transpeptidase family protein [Brevibacillus migulae]